MEYEKIIEEYKEKDYIIEALLKYETKIETRMETKLKEKLNKENYKCPYLDYNPCQLYSKKTSTR